MGAKGRSMNGSHRMEGILILKGPTIIKGQEFSKASLMDLSPTILYLLGCARPSDMDGQVLRGVFEEDFLNPTLYTMRKLVREIM